MPHNLIEIDDLYKLENHSILSTNIVAKEDNPLSTIIKKLNNSDWIKLGTNYLKETNNACPFCQREIPKEIILNLENLFDEEYEKNIETLNTVYSSYKSLSALITNKIKAIIENNIPILDYSSINKLFIKLDSLFIENLKILAEKIRFPSNKIDLIKTNELLFGINNILKEFNSTIKQNNEISTKQIQEKAKLSIHKNIWLCIGVTLVYTLLSSGLFGVEFNVETNEAFFRMGLGSSGNVSLDFIHIAIPTTFVAILSLASLAFGFFVINPLIVGHKRFYLDNREEKSYFETLFFAFNKDYLNVVKVMLLHDIYITLWTLCLIIKSEKQFCCGYTHFSSVV